MKKMMEDIKKLKSFKSILFVVLIMSFFLRVWGLGYSEFYGDETKTFYLDKTTPAFEFFLDQRKGPVQFGAVWFMEKITGGFDEFYTRIPFAIAGVLSVFTLFLVVQKIAGDKTALIASVLFGFNGFFIAFSRTIQYQSFLILFGLLAVYYALLYQEIEDKSRLKYSLLSAVFLSLSCLSHYDATFFGMVVGLILIKVIYDKKENLEEIIKEIVIYYVLPVVVIVGVFYVPYLIYGYFSGNTVNYIAKRLGGLEYSKNSSWYTFWVYNPHSVWAFLTAFLIPYYLKRADWKRNLLFLWFLVPFITFQFLFSNPGTHIHNYFIPLTIIISVGITDFMGMLKNKNHKQYFYAFLLYIFGLLFVVDLFAFIPGVNSGYPWKDSNRLGTTVSAIDKRYHLFLYGFPYKKGWDQIADYVSESSNIRKIYTNDNDTIAKYYIRGVSYTKPGPNYLPEHFIYVFNNQEFVDIPVDMLVELEGIDFRRFYEVEKEFYIEGELSAVIYQRNY